MHNNDELIEDVFGLCDLDEEIEESEDSTNEDPSKRRVVKQAKEGVNSVRLSSNDADILSFMQDKGAFSTYVKYLIRAEMERQAQGGLGSTVTKVEFDSLNNKLNQVLTMLQATQAPEDVEFIVFENENAHKFSPEALSAVAGILNKQVENNK